MRLHEAGIQELRRKVDPKAAPDFRGEEGTLHRVTVEGADYWAKRWYRTHNKPWSIPFDRNAAALSPFWARAVDARYRLIHALFPGETVEPVGAYDERVRQQDDESRFSLHDGKPVTITANVNGDRDKMAQRDVILAEMYPIVLGFRDRSMREISEVKDDPLFGKWRREINRRLSAVLGRDVTMGEPVNHPSEYDRRAEGVRALNPHSVIIDMVEAGIHPIHPEVNFFPGTPATHEREPHGTFLELDIHNLEKLRAAMEKKWQHDQDKLAETGRDWKDYVIASVLDRMFDETLFRSEFARDERILHPKITTAITRALYLLGDAMERGKVAPNDLPNLAMPVRAVMATPMPAEAIADLLNSTVEMAWGALLRE